MRFMTLVFFLLLIADHGEAARRYVTDVLYVPLRTGPSYSHKIITTLTSGQRVQISGDEDNGFIKAKTEKGQVGWIPGRYLLDTPTSERKLAATMAKLQKSEKILEPLREKSKLMKTRLKELEAQNKSLTSDQSKLQKDLKSITSLSGNAISLNEENQKLKKKLATVEQVNQSLSTKNQNLMSDNRNEGIKLGIFAIMFGVGLGFILPLLKPRRRQSNAIRLR